MKSESNKAPVVSYPEIVEALVKQLTLPKKTVDAVLQGVVSLAAAELKNGKRVQIKGLGALLVREGAASEGASPKRAILVPAKNFKSTIGI